VRGLGWSSVVNHLRCKRSQIFVSQIKFIECRIIQIYETRRRGRLSRGGRWGWVKGRPWFGLGRRWKLGRLNRKMEREAGESESEETAMWDMPIYGCVCSSTYLILFDWFWTSLGLWWGGFYGKKQNYVYPPSYTPTPPPPPPPPPHTHIPCFFCLSSTRLPAQAAKSSSESSNSSLPPCAA